ncbi:MAG TPA: hypothetical protein VF310_03045 [Vicinamibacteria bacterium]
MSRHMEYLLGRLPDEEQDRFEEESLMNDEGFEELVAAEDDLIDAYVAGRLTADDAQRFEARFLAAPARRERVAFARALRQLADAGPAVAPVPAGRPRVFTWLPVAASLAALAVGGWSLVHMQELSRTLSAVRGEQQALEGRLAAERARAEGLASDLAATRGPHEILDWTLQGGGERTGGPSNERQVPGSGWVRLRLRAPALAASEPLRAVLETAEGRRVAVQEGLRARGGVVEVMVPGGVLVPGSYVVTLQGGPPPGEALETYVFFVAPEKR